MHIVLQSYEETVTYIGDNSLSSILNTLVDELRGNIIVDTTTDTYEIVGDKGVLRFNGTEYIISVYQVETRAEDLNNYLGL